MDNSHLDNLVSFDQILDWIKSSVNREIINILDPYEIKQSAAFSITTTESKYPNLDKFIPYIKFEYYGYTLEHRNNFFINSYGNCPIKYKICNKSGHSVYITTNHHNGFNIDKEYFKYFKEINNIEYKDYPQNISIISTDKPDLSISLKIKESYIKQKTIKSFKKFKFNNNIHTIIKSVLSVCITYGNYNNTIELTNDQILKYCNLINLIKFKQYEKIKEFDKIEFDKDAQILINVLKF